MTSTAATVEKYYSSSLHMRVADGAFYLVIILCRIYGGGDLWWWEGRWRVELRRDSLPTAPISGYLRGVDGTHGCIRCTAQSRKINFFELSTECTMS